MTYRWARKPPTWDVVKGVLSGLLLIACALDWILTCTWKP